MPTIIDFRNAKYDLSAINGGIMICVSFDYFKI